MGGGGVRHPVGAGVNGDVCVVVGTEHLHLRDRPEEEELREARDTKDKERVCVGAYISSVFLNYILLMNRKAPIETKHRSSCLSCFSSYFLFRLLMFCCLPLPAAACLLPR